MGKNLGGNAIKSAHRVHPDRFLFGRFHSFQLVNGHFLPPLVLVHTGTLRPGQFIQFLVRPIYRDCYNDGAAGNIPRTEILNFRKQCRMALSLVRPDTSAVECVYIRRVKFVGFVIRYVEFTAIQPDTIYHWPRCRYIKNGIAGADVNHVDSVFFTVCRPQIAILIIGQSRNGGRWGFDECQSGSVHWIHLLNFS